MIWIHKDSVGEIPLLNRHLFTSESCELFGQCAIQEARDALMDGIALWLWETKTEARGRKN
jgi:hypothetical protein